MRLRDINEWGRWTSMQLAVLAALLASYFAAEPQAWEQLVSMLPDWTRPFTGFALFALLWWARMRPQGEK